jgi:hypothetical protein
MSHKNTIKRKIIQLLESLPDDLYGFPGDFGGLRAAAFEHLVEWHEGRLKLADENRDEILEFVYPGADPQGQFFRELGEEVKGDFPAGDGDEDPAENGEADEPKFN